MPAQTKEEFYVRRLFDDDVPVFVDATKYVRQDTPYPLSAKKALKATCGVRTDNEVLAFSLRNYTGKQAEREVEHVENTVGGRVTAQNQLRLRMPRRTLAGLNETARALAVVLGDEVITELDGDLYVLSLTRAGNEGTLALAGKLTPSEGGFVRSEAGDGDTEFELPVAGVRLRIFLRSPVRDRIIAYGFSGYLTRKPGEMETVTRATALAINSILGLATFRMLSQLDHVDVPPVPRGNAVRPRKPAEQVTFSVPALLFTDDGTPAARGRVAAEIDLDQVDPVTGGLQLHVTAGDQLEWNPAVAEAVNFEAYERVLTETIGAMLHSAVGMDTVRDLAYDIMLGDLGAEGIARLRAATTDLPGLAAKPNQAEVRSAQPATGVPAA
ncbi:hypothetical protein BKA00_007072 [Actinomadura coerulea]|uniref:Uncharacterized protein n=1 Tax=Actinomadura coerulea TaxID=46159 RepID=A0A7X0L2Z3_9ACTN|nr:hypothetical protein [Actinomadura coerulea]MBB6400158.1 hypothetical protein [Actinomadura coerulea]GGQ22400.1 hypothetical protein GCM10010187_43610 [Actinomadura coerulea]